MIKTFVVNAVSRKGNAACGLVRVSLCREGAGERCWYPVER